MKACVLYQKGDIRYTDIDEPQVQQPDEVKVKIQNGGICGSDQHYYLEGGIGSAIVVREPIVIGHEGCGIVTEVGSNVEGIKPGDMVVLRPARPCFKPDCIYCNRRQYSYCENMRHLGSAATFPHTQGLFAEYIVAHKAQCRVVKAMDPDKAAFAEPLGIAFNGVHQLGEVIGKNVLVMGAGPIGCLCVAAAKTLGADRVTAVDLRDEALELAVKMGADEVCNSKTNPDQIAKWCEHKGHFDCCLEATGNGFAAESAMRMVRPEGVVSQVGMFGTGHQPKDLGAFATKGLKWNAVFRFYDEFGPTVNALENGLIDPTPLLSAKFPAAEIQKAIEAAISPATCKVQIYFD